MINKPRIIVCNGAFSLFLLFSLSGCGNTWKLETSPLPDAAPVAMVTEDSGSSPSASPAGVEPWGELADGRAALDRLPATARGRQYPALVEQARDKFRCWSEDAGEDQADGAPVAATPGEQGDRCRADFWSLVHTIAGAPE